MRKNWAQLVAVMAAMGICTPGFAQCDILATTLDDFGLAGLGEDWTKLPDDVEVLPDCYMDDVYGAVECAFLDRAGVEYLVVENRITRKRIEIDDNKDRELPFGLTVQDRIPDVVRKIDQQQDDLALFISRESEGAGMVVHSGYCLRNEIASGFNLALYFDGAGHLRSVSTYFQPN